MGMPVSIHVRGPQARLDAAVEEAVGWVVADLHEVDATFSTYRADSAVSRRRRGELDLDEAPDAVREAAALCEEAARRTEGWFRGWLPDSPRGPRLFEPTGLVKGWAVENACRRLSGALPAYDVLVDAGGDVALACRRTDTPDWTVGIEDPRDTSRLLATLPLRSGGVATSGSPARGAHELDPRSGDPGRGRPWRARARPPLRRARGPRPALGDRRRPVAAVGRRLRDGGVRPWRGRRRLAGHPAGPRGPGGRRGRPQPHRHRELRSPAGALAAPRQLSAFVPIIA